MVEPSSAAGVVTAEDHERLEQNYAALNTQFEAANEVLFALGRSAGDPNTVLTSIVESARRLCWSEAALLYSVRSGAYELIKAVGISDELVDYITEHPIPMDRDSLIGRVGLDRYSQQIPDVLTDPQYGRQDIQRVAGFRTTMAAPLLVDEQVVGALSLWRNEVRPFNEREMAILAAFAGQAAMAINGVELVQELEARRAELARKVEELEALREVGEAVGSSLDIDHVLATIAMHAVDLSGTDGGSIMQYSERSRGFAVRATYQTEPDVIEQLRSLRIALDETLVGRAAKERRPLSVTDLGLIELDPHLRVLYGAGWRSVLAVPMLREEQIVGALIVRRKRPGDFSPETVRLLETFAGQSALALVNARLYRELETRSAELEKASTHKSEFLASMSHELRTPLNAVLGFSEVLLERMFGEINERQEEYLRDIHGSGRHLLELLNEILDLSKVEAGRMELEYTSVELGPLLESAASLLRERAELKAIDLRVEADGVGALETDQLRLRQVVLNLLTNAVKFTGEGGSVVLRVSRPDSGNVTITVADTGPGVPPEDRERIFESFQQGGRGASREEGTGLGLTLCRRIVELLGGRMWLETEVGVGSTFGFAIPTSRPGGAGRPQRAAHDVVLRDVVVIDDDRPSVDLLTAYLDGQALLVTTAGDGLSGLEAVRRVEPAVVLLDIRLPGMDGWSVLGTLKKDPATRHIPVVVVSIVDEQARGLSLGAAAHLVKPVSRDALLAALRSVGALDGNLEGDRDDVSPEVRSP